MLEMVYLSMHMSFNLSVLQIQTSCDVSPVTHQYQRYLLVPGKEGILGQIRIYKHSSSVPLSSCIRSSSPD